MVYDDICSAADMFRSEALEFLRSCIAIRSFTGMEREQADLLLSFFSDKGVPAFRTPRGSVVSMISPFQDELDDELKSGDPAGAFRNHISFLREKEIRIIAFDAHMDVVSEGDLSEWSSDPFCMSARDGMLFGRGTCDMKGAMAAMAGAMAVASCEKIPLRFCAVGCFVTEEELAEGLALDEIISDLKIVPDLVLLGEPSKNRISLGQRGKAQFSIFFEGKRAHSSQPQQGINAMYPAAGNIIAADRLDRKGYELFPDDLLKRDTIAVTGVSVLPGDASSVISHARVDMIARLAEGCTLDSLIGKLSEDELWTKCRYEAEVYDRPSYTGVKKEWKVCHTAWKTDRNSLFASALAEAFRGVKGTDPEFIVWPFSTDGVAASKHGIAALGFGPGREEMCHKPDEYVGEEAFIDALKVYLAFICGKEKLLSNYID